ncbi:hypothetical protein BV898_13400 [Hypsibius exemplaris]|uniref:Gamma-tubulin complex component n=1 Tax=Hypsibius exemplaris TaxID=2072580 RepID=A0A1W0WAT2_HYPEX|nr:hypothetical protein BV898_13400 [Hypsibius exemplaris]
MYQALPGLSRTTDTSLPLMELLCRLAGYGPTAEKPAWAKFCSPPEQEMLGQLLQIGAIRRNLTEYSAKCDALGMKGHYAVASVASCVKLIFTGYDKTVARLGETIQTPAPPTLNSICTIVSEHEGALLACVGYLTWLIDETKPAELFIGKLLDESHRRLEISHGSARQANEAIFEALFVSFKRTLLPWLAYGFLDSRTDYFFISEPADCRIYFREIAPYISTRNRAPGHFSGRLVENIAQHGYVRKFLGWRTKNALNNPVLEDQIVALSDRLRNVSWKEYRSAALEDIVDGFGEIYSHALFVSIFQQCKVSQILHSFQQMYLMGFVDLFDAFVSQASTALSMPLTIERNAANDANMNLDLAFEGTAHTRKYDPFIQNTGGSAVKAEKVAERGFASFYFVLRVVDDANAKPVWESLDLEFAVRHPLDWFFHPRAMAQYKQIFRFLLRMKRLNNAFGELWTALRGASISGRLSELDLLELFRWQYNFSHVISAVQSYIQVDIIEQAWEELQRKLTHLEDYVLLMEAHDAFLACVMNLSMIDNPILHRCVNLMVKTSLEVANAICTQINRPVEYEVNLENVRANILDLESSLKVFVKLVHSSNSSGDRGSSGGHSLSGVLALKLDFATTFQQVLLRPGVAFLY